eukprot:CAMPEP_0167773448 /NCGR_PEP_ID=MMETSP0111_2-20121227/1424_1 /TAXON_ID=91324 /ORGANISM="Lotharella globosa, Strain CCCM811" /LENGTH=868 /DNA_ID=CAMNT_0007663083 /DNA_START=8 /DNA_END=2615 /DNA_ORIENTATION=+
MQAWKQTASKHPTFQLPGDFGPIGGARVQELSMMAQVVWLVRDSIANEKKCAAVLADLEAFTTAYPEMKNPQDLLAVEKSLKTVLSSYNSACRLRINDKDSWPRAELGSFVPPNSGPCLPPPQTPCEYIDEKLGWWGYGRFSEKESWVGHGYWWKPLPSDAKEGFLENAAGNAAADCDVMEDRFHKLKKASVITADYDLLRADFPELYALSDADINKWLVSNAAYLSAGQVRRISKGGDHYEKLGITDVDDYIDKSDLCSAIRMRSGGRAATFFTNGGRYRFVNGRLVAGMLDVKGIGTHELADVSHPKVTGLLNYADALRGLMIQKLIQGLIDLEGLDHEVSTVKFYGIIDTGLAYQGENPATGWKNEKCVLAVRQRQSRMLDGYEGFNFSGVCPSQVLAQGPGRQLRRLLIKYGISAEFFPRALLYAPSESDGVTLARGATGGLIDDFEGTWNLQADSTGRYFMDFTDFYVLPRSPLPKCWRMTEEGLRNAMTLERTPFVKLVMSSPELRRRIFGEESKEAADKAYRAHLEKLSKDDTLLEACHKVDEKTGLIVPNKPKYCMCWCMELDDSEMTKWAMATSKSDKRVPSIVESIRANLPRVALPDPADPPPAPGYERLPVHLQPPTEANVEARHPAYHAGWTPGKKQAPKHDMKCVTLDPKKMGSEGYRFFISCVVPRPIALVSSISASGSANLAPYSYFGAMNHNPPTVCFSPCRNRGGNERDGYDKDTLRNIKETKQFVVHIMSNWYVDVANHTCGNYLYGEDEFKLSGATPIPSIKVKPPRVKEAAIQMECQLEALHEIKDETGLVKATMVIGRVVLFHVHDAVLDKETTTVMLEKLQPNPEWEGTLTGKASAALTCHVQIGA